MRKIYGMLLSAAILLACCAVPVSAKEMTAAPLLPVQAFDVAAGKVIKSVPNDSEFQEMAMSWLKSVTGLAPQLTADDSCSYVYRLPLSSPATVKAGDISIVSNDLFLFYCKDKPPTLLLFDQNKRPYLFLFNADIAPFIKKIGIPAG
ncbi:hypothetical protein M6D81_06180 [Paenibacillus sp. J5C_2022]|uniref:hypothetical protein n=1 Tax=Paenibacillus sp. J5C2022 TaxID=2977129 RepID=UPI0021D300BA|nr:hypothetical protein [Paenibacillus sp. J5C2022]MCU6708297.1 hypothetical protein [Paenibacillus sp. J5C2022]